MLLRILQASGKATEFLASIVMEEVKNLGKVFLSCSEFIAVCNFRDMKVFGM